MRVERLVVDTGVIVEYLDEESPYSGLVEELFEGIARGAVKAYLLVTTLSEVLYVSARVYREGGVEDPEGEAGRFVAWLLGLFGVSVVRPTLEMGLLAGEIRMRARISLFDCYVVAAARVLGATPLFLRLEREMKPYMGVLNRYGVRFLVTS